MHTIIPTGPVPDRESRIGYQRIRALASRYHLIVVTTAPLPGALRAQVAEEHIVTGALDMWRQCLHIGKRLSGEGKAFFIHTQWAPKPLVAGYLCKRRFGCCWIYDLSDHPSLTWSGTTGLGKLLRQLAWILALKNLLKHADAWVIAMHPAVLSHLPVPSPRCRIILTSPGVRMRKDAPPVPSSSDSELREVVVCYAGPVIAIRGASLILDWAARYDGPPVRLELMGSYDAASEKGVNRLMRNPRNAGRMNIRLHGDLPHVEVLRIMRDGDIGICLIDPTVLNYRYAYPIKVVEYMSQGLVTVATDGHGVRAFVRHGENGFVSDYDLDSFARTMTEAIEACANEGRRRELVENATRTVEARDWDIVNSALLADIGTVVGQTK